MFHISADAMREMLRVLASRPAAIENGTADFYTRQIPEVSPGFELDMGTQTWRVS